MKKITFKRDQLYKEVWSTPMIHLAEKYGVRYNQLKKVCKELEIPIPPSGHWSRVRNGKEVKVVELLESDKDTFTLNITDKIKSEGKEKKPERKIFVPKTLSNPHPLVKEAKERQKGRTWVNHFGRVKLFPLNITVAPTNVNRALRIMDGILKMLQKQGKQVHHYIEYSASKMYITYEGYRVYLQLRENGTRRKRDKKENNWGYDEYDYLPNGRLKLLLFNDYWGGPSKTISDTATQKLEDRLDEFFDWLEINEERLRIKRLEDEELRRQNKIQCLIKEEAERQRKAELERRKKLEEQSEFFTKSQYVYDFVKEIEKQEAQLDLDDAMRQKVDSWIVWARKHADRLNPVKQVMNSILESSLV